MKVIEARGISRHFFHKENKQQIKALNNIHLDVPFGKITALVGPDGAGKTTLMSLVAGLLEVQQGELIVLGENVAQFPQQIQNRISYMPQKFGLYEDLSVLENLNLYADLHAVPAQTRQSRFAHLLAMTDLSRFTERPAGKLSGGMKQKLGLACALVRSPELLLLDEPTVGVDPLSRRELWQIIEQLIQAEQLTVLAATAYMDEAERCAQVYVMHEGNIIDHGTPQQLISRAEGRCFSYAPAAHELPRTIQAQLLDDSEQIIDAVPHAGQVRFIVRHPHRLAELGLDRARIQAVPPQLEDCFMLLLRAQATPTELQKNAPIPPAVTLGEPIIQIRELVRRFGDFIAVNKTTFEVKRGEIFGLLGPNGAGKTTTFRMLCGLLPASQGEAMVAGVNMRTASAQARAKLGYVSQKFALYGNLNVLENLQFFGKAYGLYGKILHERIQAILQQFDLQGLEKTRAGELAGGLKQRLAMAVGLLHQPEILFLDEPTSGADPLARRIFWRRITDLAANGTTVVITTHFMEEAEYCDRIVIQDAGQLLALGSPAEVRRQAGEAEQPLNMEQAFINIVEQGRRARSRP